MFLDSGPAQRALTAVVLSCRDSTGDMINLEFAEQQPHEAREVLARCIDEARQDRKELFNRASKQRNA